MAKRLKTHPDQDQDQDQDQTLVHCPRCDSTNTKFCYYNNYSLSQPRYFCKSCRRYWTKGGTLRNIPIGGVSRKNKRISSVSATNHHHHRRHEMQPQLNPHNGELAIFMYFKKFFLIMCKDLPMINHLKCEVIMKWVKLNWNTNVLRILVFPLFNNILVVYTLIWVNKRVVFVYVWRFRLLDLK